MTTITTPSLQLDGLKRELITARSQATGENRRLFRRAINRIEDLEKRLLEIKYLIERELG